MRRAGLLVAVLTVAAFVLRVIGIDQSLFGDEVFTYDIVTRHGLGGVLDAVHRTSITPPLHYVLAWASVQLGDPTETIRIPSLVAGTASVPAIWLLGRATVGEWAGVVGAALAAFSPFAVYYGQEARTYALLVLLVTLSTLGLVRALQSGRRPWWALFVLSTAAALYSHYTAVFPLAAQFLWALWTQPNHRRQILLAHAGTAALWAPWIPFYLDQRGNGGVEALGLLNPFSLGAALSDFGRLPVGHPYVPLSELPGTMLLGVVVVVCSAALVRARRIDWGLVLIAGVALAAPTGEVVYSWLATPILAPRNLLAGLSGLLLLLGACTSFPKSNLLRLVSAGTLIAVTLLTGLREQATRYERPPARSVAEWLDRNAPRSEPIVVVTYFHDALGRQLALRSVQLNFQRPHRASEVLAQELPNRLEADRRRRVWVIVPEVYGLRGTAAPPASLAHLDRQGRARWNGLADYAVYGYAARLPTLTTRSTLSDPR